ncbi:uncharacterized protein LOC100367478 [Saccoglossus kowalevskii]
MTAMVVYNVKLEDVMPGEQCTFISTTSDQYRIVTVVDEHGNYESDVSCKISFRTDESKKFFLRVTRMDMEFSNQCASDSLRIYDGTSENDASLTGNAYGICGRSLSLPNYFYSTGNAVSVQFVTDNANNNGEGFDILVTAYKPVDSTEECEDVDGFLCLDGSKCMSKNVYCNGHSQCAEGSDEPTTCSNVSGRASISSFLLAFTVTMTTILFASTKHMSHHSQ